MPLDEPGLWTMVEGMKFACQLTEERGAWRGEYTSPGIGPVRVTAPTRAEVLKKLEGEIRYWLELCACSGEAYRDIEIEVLEATSENQD